MRLAILATPLFAAPLIMLSCHRSACQTPVTTPKKSWSAQRSKVEFDVASVRQNKAEGQSSMNVDPTSGNQFAPTGGLYSARNIALISYISFAYKLTNLQLQSVVSQVPWVAQDRFDIEARAEGNPTKDQYRLMMRSLLETRFKLAVHEETRQGPIFGLVVAKPGEFGPQLRLHSATDSVCSTPAAAPGSSALKVPPSTATDPFPPRCGALMRMQPSAPGRMKTGGRDVPVTLMAAVLPGIGNLGRPMVDQTGLTGNVDFSLEWGMVAANLPNGQEFHPDESAPTFETALKEQLGLKLKPEVGPVEFFIVDHVEHTNAN